MRIERRTAAVLAIAVALLCIAAAGIAVWKAQRALNGSERSLRTAGNLPFTVHTVAVSPNPGFETMPAPGAFKSAASFQGGFYLAGPGGLYAYSEEGVLQHLYRCGLELPAAPLGQMAVGTLADAHQPELLIATSGEGVLAFDGRAFRQIRAEQPEARQITALLPLASGRLLLGTAKLGLLVYDGKTLKAFHPTTSGMYVTALAGTESDLWIGTLDRGVLDWRGGETQQISEAQGLPDVRVEAIAIRGDTVYAGTPVGTAELIGDKVARVLAPGRYAHALLPQSDSLLAGEFEGGILSIRLAGPAGNRSLRRAIRLPGEEADRRGEAAGIEQFLAIGNDVYAVSSDGLLRRNPERGWSRILGDVGSLLTDRDISALLPAADGRLWIGYFDRGLDILSATGSPVEHVENDHVFCVNRIVDDPRKGAVAVATANGLAMFSADGRERQVLDRESGLISGHVTDVILYGDGMAAATPAGITFLDASGAHSIYAFEGLVNNHVYALGAYDNQLLAGTLGGISLLRNGQVERNLTTANSGLKANWITGLTRAGDGWLVGTYGNGVMRLDSGGNVTATEATRNGVIVNPGAILSDGRVTLAGTMGQGLLVSDAAGMRWRWVTAGLPSLNVTALAVDKGIVYVGTDNGLVRIDEGKL
jgi:ligand-binding sensor domain-containing protein